jgi:hypothetical protein
MTAISAILEKLLQRFGCTKQKNILLGFDGFIDTIAKPIFKSGNETTQTVYFSSIEEFGGYIAGHGHKSTSIEMDIMDRRMGGNVPNFAQTMTALGLNPLCIGMFGDGNETLDPLFRLLPGDKISYAPVGTACALEFGDGKIFLAPRYVLEGSPWPRIEKACRARFPDGPSPESLLDDADFIGCLNLGELSFMDSLLEDMFKTCASFFSVNKKKIIFFDLCDFSRKTSEEVRNIISLIRSFTAFRTVVLSLNHNEAVLLAGELFADKFSGSRNANLRGIAETILADYGLDEVIVHSHHYSLTACREGVYVAATSCVTDPKIFTGAGDNFNAAYAFAALSDLPVEERLQFANYYAYIYISSGTRYNIEGLVNCRNTTE